jgi:hypothetical protein
LKEDHVKLILLLNINILPKIVVKRNQNSYGDEASPAAPAAPEQGATAPETAPAAGTGGEAPATGGEAPASGGEAPASGGEAPTAPEAAPAPVEQQAPAAAPSQASGYRKKRAQNSFVFNHIL